MERGQGEGRRGGRGVGWLHMTLLRTCFSLQLMVGEDRVVLLGDKDSSR